MKNLMTVNGEVDPASCGMVLPHEHWFIDLRNQAADGASTAAVAASDRPRLMCDPYAMRDNLLLDDLSAAIDEAKALVALGCDTAVDCSSARIGRDPLLLRRLSAASGLKLVMGCGYYTADTHPESVRTLSVEALAYEMISEIENGVGDTSIRPGVIGEIGSSKEILPGERKVLQASAIVQRRTGLAVQVHIYPWAPNGLEAARILMDGGVAPDRIVICHSDVEPDRKYIRQLLTLGVYVELDNFGKEFTPAPGGFAGGKFVPDTERAALAAWIIESGFGEQLLLTNDICLKCMLRSRGGQGYSHVFADILPLLVKLGIPETYLKQTVCRENPLRMLCGRS